MTTPPATKVKFYTKCRRARMTNGGIPFQGSAAITTELKRRMWQIDDRLELHQIGKEVHCYRISHGTAASTGSPAGSDILTHQFVLKYPPGDWLIDCLNACDMWKKAPSPEVAAKKQLKLYKHPGDIEAALAEKKLREAMEAAAPDLNKYGGRNATFDIKNRGYNEPRNRNVILG